MADKEVVIGVKVETGDSQRTLGDLEKEFERLNEEIRKVPVGSADFDKLSREMAQVGKEVKNAELAFESLDTEQTAAELGSVAGAVGDVSAAFILLGDDSEELQEVAQNIELALGLSMGLKGAIEGVSSARKLLTNSTKAQLLIEKAKLAVSKEGIIVTTAQNAVEKLSNFIKTGSAVTNAQLAASEVARGTATAGATAATAASTTAMKLFRLALISTGIGAIVVGLGLLIANFDKVKEVVIQATAGFKDLGTGMKVVIGIVTFGLVPMYHVLMDTLKEYGIVESDEEKARRIRQEEADKRLKEFTQNKIDNINEEINAIQRLTKELSSAIDWEIEKRKAAGEDFSNLEQEKIRMLIASTKQEIDLINQKIAAKQKEIDQTKLANGIKSNIELIAYKKDAKNQEEFLEEQFKALELWSIKQEKFKKDQIKKSNSNTKKGAEKEKEITLEKLQQIEKAEIQTAKNIEQEKSVIATDGILETYKAQNDLRIELMEEGLAKEKQLLEVAFFERLQKLEEEGVLTNELRVKLFKDYQDQQKALEDEASKERFNTAINNAEQLNKGLSDLNNAVLEAKLAAEQAAEQKETDNLTERLHKDLEMAGNNNELKLSLEKEYQKNLKALAEDSEEKKQEIRKKAFKRQKALDIADATIQGIKAVQAALASPFPFNIALAAINGATAAANIAKIASVQFEGESGGGGASADLGNTARATGGANVPQVANTTTTIGDPTQVYVLEQDISNTQNKVSVNEQQATL